MSCPDFCVNGRLREGRELEPRLLGEGPPPVAVDDEKSVNGTVDAALRKQREGRAVKPAADHPWNAIARAAANLAEAKRLAREASPECNQKLSHGG